MTERQTGEQLRAAARNPFQFSLRTLLLFFVVTGAGLPALLLLLSTRGGRSYFSPDTLNTKHQTERLLFGTDIPVYRSEFTFDRYELVDYLISKGYWHPKPVDDPRWMQMNHWNLQWRDGHSNLYAELAWHEDRWMTWSEEHPELAAVVWPIVLETLRRNRTPYDAQEATFMILWFARDSSDIAEFKRNINQNPEYPGLSLSLESTSGSVAASTIKTDSLDTERALADLQEAGFVEWSLDSSLVGLTSGLILSFEGGNPSDDNLTALRRLHDLYELDFGKMAERAGPTDAQLRHLTHLTQLRALCLNNTHVTDEGLSHIMPLRNLEILDLSDTAVTYKALEPLLRMLPNLRWLHIEENWQITLDEVRKLEALRPGCQVIR